MNPSHGIRYAGHARDQMDEREESEDQVLIVLTDFHTSYSAPPLPFTDRRAIIYVGTVNGETLRIYVEEHSDPPLVLTVAWKDD